MEYLSPLWELARARAAFLAFGYNGCNIENLILVILAVLAKREEIVCFPLTFMFPLNDNASLLRCHSWLICNGGGGGSVIRCHSMFQFCFPYSFRMTVNAIADDCFFGSDHVRID